MASFENNKLIYQQRSYLRTLRMTHGLLYKHRLALWAYLSWPLCALSLLTTLLYILRWWWSTDVTTMPVAYLALLALVLSLAGCCIWGLCSHALHTYLRTQHLPRTHRWHGYRPVMQRMVRLWPMYVVWLLVTLVLLCVAHVLYHDSSMPYLCVLPLLVLYVISVPASMACLSYDIMGYSLPQALRYGGVHGLHAWGSSSLVLLFSSMIVVVCVCLVAIPLGVLQLALQAYHLSIGLGDAVTLPTYFYVCYALLMLVLQYVAFTLVLYPYWAMVLQLGSCASRQAAQSAQARR